MNERYVAVAWTSAVTVHIIFRDEFVRERRSRATLLGAEEWLFIVDVSRFARETNFPKSSHIMGRGTNSSNLAKSLIRVTRPCGWQIANYGHNPSVGRKNSIGTMVSSIM